MSSQAGSSPMAQEVLALSESGCIQQVPGPGTSFSEHITVDWLLCSHFPLSPLSLPDTNASLCFHIDFPHSGLVWIQIAVCGYGEAGSVCLRIGHNPTLHKRSIRSPAMQCQPHRAECLCDIQEGGPLSGRNPNT